MRNTEASSWATVCTFRNGLAFSNGLAFGDGFQLDDGLHLRRQFAVWMVAKDRETMNIGVTRAANLWASIIGDKRIEAAKQHAE